MCILVDKKPSIKYLRNSASSIRQDPGHFLEINFVSLERSRNKSTVRNIEWFLRSAFTFASTNSDQICLASGELVNLPLASISLSMNRKNLRQVI